MSVHVHALVHIFSWQLGKLKIRLMSKCVVYDDIVAGGSTGHLETAEDAGAGEISHTVSQGGHSTLGEEVNSAGGVLAVVVRQPEGW